METLFLLALVGAWHRGLCARGFPPRRESQVCDRNLRTVLIPAVYHGASQPDSSGTFLVVFSLGLMIRWLTEHVGILAQLWGQEQRRSLLTSWVVMS